MTTIVYNPKTRELAADKRTVWGNRYVDTSNKLLRGKNFVMVACGTTGYVYKMLALACELIRQPGQQPEDVFLRDLDAEVILRNPQLTEALVDKAKDADVGMMMFVLHDGCIPKIYELFHTGRMQETKLNSLHAIGSGAEFAIGAMEAGLGVKRAIRIASKHNWGTSAQCDIIKPFDAETYSNGY